MSTPTSTRDIAPYHAPARASHAVPVATMSPSATTFATSAETLQLLDDWGRTYQSWYAQHYARQSAYAKLRLRWRSALVSAQTEMIRCGMWLRRRGRRRA